MPGTEGDRPGGAATSEAGPHAITDATSLEELPASSRGAVRRLREQLRAKARVPVYALVGGDWAERARAAQTLCALEQGQYVHIGEYVRQQVLANESLRTEWLGPSYLAGLVIELARARTAPLLVVDGWEALLGLVRQAGAGGPAALLRDLVYRALPIPVVLVLGVGPGGYSSVAEVRRIMETEGRLRVVGLDAGDEREVMET